MRKKESGKQPWNTQRGRSSTGELSPIMWELFTMPMPVQTRTPQNTRQRKFVKMVRIKSDRFERWALIKSTRT
jgi:hypothetical protein